MFQACLVVNPSQVVCFENHAEWRFCLAPFGVSRLVGAVALGWRSGARARCVASFLRSRLVSCTCALLWMFILTHATALIAVSFKPVISTAPSSTKQEGEGGLKEARRQRNRLLRLQKIQTRSQVRVDLWAIHPTSPPSAMADTVRRTEDGAGRAQSFASGRSES